MRIISFIEDPSVIRDILNHLGLLLVKARPPPIAHVLPMGTQCSIIARADDDLQLQAHADNIYGDPESAA
ncbi:MAG: hypothetical protein ACYC6Q_12265 [Syntrophales bacterium]